jgi:hypothetical protein
MSTYESPSAIIADFRISDPSEIDIEAIAHSRRATIIYEPIDGCAARILGNGDHAITTVDDGPNLGRRRFSPAHEFGHWMRDRAKIRFACTDQASFYYTTDGVTVPTILIERNRAQVAHKRFRTQK